MANVLCQIRGNKRVVLYSPKYVNELCFAPGASSSTLNVFEANKRLDDMHVTRYEADLNPGDILYIPAVWPHAAAPTDGTSTAVNVFFRSLQHGYAAGKDVYGNRDLQGYENGRRDVQKIAKAFRDVPFDVRGFYMKRLAQELLELAG